MTVDLVFMRHGPPDARALVFHVGTPNAPAEFPVLTDALDDRGSGPCPTSS